MFRTNPLSTYEIRVYERLYENWRRQFSLPQMSRPAALGRIATARVLRLRIALSSSSAECRPMVYGRRAIPDDDEHYVYARLSIEGRGRRCVRNHRAKARL